MNSTRSQTDVIETSAVATEKIAMLGEIKNIARVSLTLDVQDTTLQQDDIDGSLKSTDLATSKQTPPNTAEISSAGMGNTQRAQDPAYSGPASRMASCNCTPVACNDYIESNIDESVNPGKDDANHQDDSSETSDDMGLGWLHNDILVRPASRFSKSIEEDEFEDDYEYDDDDDGPSEAAEMSWEEKMAERERRMAQADFFAPGWAPNDRELADVSEHHPGIVGDYRPHLGRPEPRFEYTRDEEDWDQWETVSRIDL